MTYQYAAPVYAAPAGVPLQAMPMSPLYSNRVTRHMQTLGMLWLIYAAWRFITKLSGLLIAHTFLAHSDMFGLGPFPGSMFSAVMPFAITSLFVSSALSVLTGYALLTRQSWGRIIGIVCAIFSLIHPILGTALGIYTLWVLAPHTSGVEYDLLTRTAPQAQS